MHFALGENPNDALPRRGEIGRLVLGFVLSATASLLPESLRVFREQFPAVEMVLEEITTAQGLTALAEGHIHLAFVRLPLGELSKSFTLESVLKEEIMLALPAAHTLRAKEQVSLRMLATEPFIIFPRTQGAGFYDHLVRSGFSPRVVQEAGQMQTNLSLVAAGLGVALIPATVQSLRSEGVVYKPLRAGKLRPHRTASCAGGQSVITRSEMSFHKLKRSLLIGVRPV